MTKGHITFLLILLLFIPFWLLFNKSQSNLHVQVPAPQSFPAPVLKILSGGHYAAAAQNLYYKTMFYNELRAKEGNFQIDYKTTLRLLDIATQLDPYNMDCYYYGQASLADQIDFVKPLNRMLLRGSKYRTWDHYPSWFLGSNYYFTLHDKTKAGKYFAEAAKRNPKVPFFATLAARSFHEGAETEKAVKMLKEMLLQASSPVITDTIRKRLQAFETVLFLRQALKRYQNVYKKNASTLEDLITNNILKAIPPDPYGGKFYLDENKNVQTTSNFAMKRTK